jgi:hypothetical protein
VTDPEQPSRPEPTAPKPVLMGTLELDEGEFALMLSGDPAKDTGAYRRIKVGDSLEGYKLLKILDQRVLMDLNGSAVEVRLNEPSKLVARDQTPPRTCQGAISHPVAPVGGQTTTIGGPLPASTRAESTGPAHKGTFLPALW